MLYTHIKSTFSGYFHIFSLLYMWGLFLGKLLFCLASGYEPFLWHFITGVPILALSISDDKTL